MTYTEQIKQLTQQYNDVIRALETQYEMEHSQQGFFQQLSSTHSLKREYSNRYTAVAQEYRRKCRELLQQQKLANPAWAKGRTLWGWVFVVGVVLLFAFCSSSMPGDDTSPSTLMSETDEHYWNAENIPIPYLQDATQYVSNPDGVLSQPAVDRMNVTLKLLDDSLKTQTIVIVVNRIENDDPFRFAQDVGNKYGVGFDDRGLVIAVGYQDHSINMSPGRRLEADLTDAECHRLEQRYVVPAMRAEMPDSGMVYLVEAVYSLLQSKQLPQMSQLVDIQEQQDEEMVKTIGLFMLLFIGWGILFIRLNRKYQWLGALGSTALLGNPFVESSGGGFYVGGGGGGFGRGGGGFGGGGGSFGGGSFGGGGATSRW
jgi:uncharacterized membrane protein YgcG